MAAPSIDDRPPQFGQDVNDAADFLKKLGEDHLLCSIDPQGGAIHCQRGDAALVLRWAEAENAAGRNIYYHFNVVRADVCGKASSKDITHIRGVPDDVDWGWKHHGGRYPERLHDLLEQQQQLQRSSTPPTLTVFTGGGFQNVYLFPSPVEATPEIRRRVEALSRSFVADRGSDFVGNPDRLLRLPGFINHPNKHKADAGQPTIMASSIPGERPHLLARGARTRVRVSYHQLCMALVGPAAWVPARPCRRYERTGGWYRVAASRT